MKKYKIQELLDRLPWTEYGKAINELVEKLGVGKNTFYKWRNYPAGSERSINSDALIIIADYFDITVDELINRPTPSPAQATKKAS